MEDKTYVPFSLNCCDSMPSHIDEPSTVNVMSHLVLIAIPGQAALMTLHPPVRHMHAAYRRLPAPVEISGGVRCENSLNWRHPNLRCMGLDNFTKNNSALGTTALKRQKGSYFPLPLINLFSIFALLLLQQLAIALPSHENVRMILSSIGPNISLPTLQSDTGASWP